MKRDVRTIIEELKDQLREEAAEQFALEMAGWWGTEYKPSPARELIARLDKKCGDPEKTNDLVFYLFARLVQAQRIRFYLNVYQKDDGDELGTDYYFYCHEREGADYYGIRLLPKEDLPLQDNQGALLCVSVARKEENDA